MTSLDVTSLATQIKIREKEIRLKNIFDAMKNKHLLNPYKHKFYRILTFNDTIRKVNINNYDNMKNYLCKLHS